MLKIAKSLCQAVANLYTKSGIMVGLGETRDEIFQAMRDLHDVRCDIITIGQYLAPSSRHVPVARFVSLEEFEQLNVAIKEMGFLSATAGPFVRNSYQAKNILSNNHDKTCEIHIR